MSECRDCFHRFLCSILENKGYQRDCRQFVDRSLFVVLPCKIGDAIFCTTMGKIYQGIVGRIELDNEGFAIITTDGYCFDSSICYHTQEEAEQALKERDNNG